jgi:PPK2 family polyphosphate:nucleotide phosphotransferase
MNRLDKISTKAPKEFDKKETKEETEKLLGKFSALQQVLYAENKHSLLIIIQGMDASGKDGAIKNVFSQINPQGVFVTSFKEPTEEERKHDFLWRIHPHCPARGMIAIFNRSHYEDVLITRVHGWCDDKTAKERFKAINDFEQLISKHNETSILKFYLHISKEEQQKRFRDRLEDPSKHWKYNINDFQEANHWDQYMKMYEDVFENCSNIPWIIVPSDQNWYKEHIIASTIVNHLKELKMKFPELENNGRG